MKAKNVAKVCAAKLKQFLSHVPDEGIKKTIQENAIITGGSIASMLRGEEVNDFDIYFRTKDATLAVAKHYAERFALNPPSRFKSGTPVSVVVDDLPDRVRVRVQSAGVASENGAEKEYQYFEQTDPESGDAAEYAAAVFAIISDQQDQQNQKDKPKFRPVFLSSNAITLSDKIQIVTRFYGEPDAIHANYDFVHCTNYWTSWDRRLVLRPEAVEALLAKELRYVGSKYPLCSIIRSRKFIQRGWSITAGQYLKMIMQLQELDLKSVKVLEEQLTGVDSAYFDEVICALKDTNPERVDTTYLVQLIDHIF